MISGHSPEFNPREIPLEHVLQGTQLSRWARSHNHNFDAPALGYGDRVTLRTIGIGGMARNV